VAQLTTPGVAVEVTLLGAAPAVLTGSSHRGAMALASAFETAFGVPTVRCRSGWSIPVATAFQQALGAPMMISGVADAGSGAHAPNEHLGLDNFHRGTEALIHLMWSLGRAD
jgi:acetylornithine deacetylase/succinyl-diaminopimelate desuccinylase-like protein